MSTDTSMEEVQSVVLETDELESLKESQTNANFEILSQSNFP